MNKILDLPLKREWYEMIERGEKTEEYRMIKPYWCVRLAHCDMRLCWMRTSYNTDCQFQGKLSLINRRGYTHVRFRYGYTKRTMLFELESIRIGRGRPEWGAPEDNDVFILKLGNRIDSAWLH